MRISRQPSEAERMGEVVHRRALPVRERVMAGELMGRLASRIAVVALAVAGCKYDNGYTTGPTPPPNAQVVSATGDVTAALAQFRGLLGDSANRTAGEQPGGRREINWDGVNGAVLNVDTF